MNAKLRTSFSSHRPMHRLVRRSADRLTVETTQKVQIVAIGCGVAAMVILLATAGRGLVYAAVLALGAIGAWCFPGRVALDRRQGVVTVRRFFRSHRFALRDITAISILDGGWHSRYQRRGYHSKRLVLNLQGDEDEEEAVVCLTDHGDDAVTAAMAAEIAEFLRVPLLDETRADSPVRPPR